MAKVAVFCYSGALAMMRVLCRGILFGMLQRRIPSHFRRAGFTLIELLVVIAIIGILSTLAVVALASTQQSSRIAKARGDIDTIATAILLLGADTVQWPNHQPVESACTSCASNEVCDDGCTTAMSSDVTGLTQNDGTTPYPNWHGPYMAIIPLDPWGNEYFFDNDYVIGGSNTVVVGSYGPNGQGLNDYDSDDIIRRLY